MGNIGVVIGGGITLSSFSACTSISELMLKRKLKKLKIELLSFLKSGKRITFAWNCGGDEAMVDTNLGKEGIQLSSDEMEYLLQDYVYTFLNLPDVGEFSMTGEGELKEKEGDIYIEYESTLIGYQDGDEHNPDLGWKEVNEKDEENSGYKKLFED